MAEFFNDSIFNIPVLLTVAKIIASILIIGIAIGISYGLLIFLIWYHFSTSHPFEALVVYVTIVFVLGMWYLAGVLYGKVWKRAPED